MQFGLICRKFTQHTRKFLVGKRDTSVQICSGFTFFCAAGGLIARCSGYFVALGLSSQTIDDLQQTKKSVVYSGKGVAGYVTLKQTGFYSSRLPRSFLSSLKRSFVRLFRFLNVK